MVTKEEWVELTATVRAHARYSALQRMIADRARAEGFTAGAESMRELAAQTVERLTDNPDDKIYYRASLVLERIRAIPTEVKP